MDAAIAVLLVTSTLAGSPVIQPVVDPITPATTITLREAAVRARIADAPQLEVRQPAKARPTPRFSKIERAIAIGAGTVIGFYGGAAIGWKATDNPSNPNDDTSGLRGVVVGAPLGALVGAVLGAVLTR
jgi:hypothetical protein